MGSDPVTFVKVLEPGPFIEAGYEPLNTAHITARTCFSRIRSEIGEISEIVVDDEGSPKHGSYAEARQRPLSVCFRIALQRNDDECAKPLHRIGWILLVRIIYREYGIQAGGEGG